MNIISRHCINPEIIVHNHNHNTKELLCSYDYKNFCRLIDHWKIFLIEKHNVRPGQTICPAIGPNIFYYAMLFAAAELGLVLIVDHPHAYKEEDLQLPKMKIHGKIDFISTAKFLHDPEHPNYIYWEEQRDLTYGNVMLYEEDYHNYEIKDIALFNKMSDTIWATPSSPLVYSSTSGPIGMPKKIVNTHEKIYLMAQRLGAFYVEKNSKILHIQMIHHGASMCNHFLPGFMLGKEQFTFATSIGFIPGMAEFINDNEINQLFLMTPWMLTDYLKNTKPAKHKINIITLLQITTEVLTLVKKKNINFIKSLFGDTAIGSGFFIKTVDQTTDLESYDVNNMGPALDDFFQFELRKNCLYVLCPTLNEDWATSNDQFEKIGDDYYFQGRATQYRINSEWINKTDIEQKVRELFGPTGANIVFDPDMQKVYLAIWEENTEAEKKLETYFVDNYNTVNISYVLRKEIYNNFFTSKKIDHSKIRQACRQNLLSKVDPVK
jgi:acyl-CoA synthetase (AMP-forming)/AMP-acid ligase II